MLSLGEQQWTLQAGTDTITIGRASNADIRLQADDQISRIHARLNRDGGTWTLHDESRNGTGLNGRRLTAPTPLTNGDRIHIGRSVLTFHKSTTPSPHSTDTPPTAPPAPPAASAPASEPPPAAPSPAPPQADPTPREPEAPYADPPRPPEYAAPTPVTPDEPNPFPPPNQPPTTNSLQTAPPPAASPFAQNEQLHAPSPFAQNEQPHATSPFAQDEQPHPASPFTQNEQAHATSPFAQDQQPHPASPFTQEDQAHAAGPFAQNEQPHAPSPFTQEEQAHATSPFAQDQQPHPASPFTQNEQAHATSPFAQDQQPHPASPFTQDDEAHASSPFTQDQQAHAASPFTQDEQAHAAAPFAPDEQPHASSPFAHNEQPHAPSPFAQDEQARDASAFVQAEHSAAAGPFVSGEEVSGDGRPFEPEGRQGADVDEYMVGAEAGGAAGVVPGFERGTWAAYPSADNPEPVRSPAEISAQIDQSEANWNPSAGWPDPTDRRASTADQLPGADDRLPRSERRLPGADHRLPRSERLPGAEGSPGAERRTADSDDAVGTVRLSRVLIVAGAVIVLGMVVNLIVTFLADGPGGVLRWLVAPGIALVAAMVLALLDAAAPKDHRPGRLTVSVLVAIAVVLVGVGIGGFAVTAGAKYVGGYLTGNETGEDRLIKPVSKPGTGVMMTVENVTYTSHFTRVEVKLVNTAKEAITVPIAGTTFTAADGTALRADPGRSAWPKRIATGGTEHGTLTFKGHLPDSATTAVLTFKSGSTSFAISNIALSN
ncbi:FHA domain-containing protein [Kribbella sp. VKM Ac-2566]|nr:FHA domain-containing protein [Kribbella sp. VKM Ac-2566]